MTGHHEIHAKLRDLRDQIERIRSRIASRYLPSHETGQIEAYLTTAADDVMAAASIFGETLTEADLSADGVAEVVR